MTRVSKYRIVLSLAGVLLLGACAEQTIRRDSRDAMRTGQFESAVQVLEDGLKDRPTSVVLRSGLIQARTEAVAQLIASAGSLRAQDKVDEAQQQLQRAKQIDPANARVESMLAELDTHRRQLAALSRAQRLADEQKPEAALRVLEAALKDNARNPSLVALQRKLELDLRQSHWSASRPVLAETRSISLDFRDANLRTVLDVVSRNSGINFILDRDIRPDVRVTVLLRQAKVEDALDLITGTNQLAKKVIDPQTVVIYPNTPDKQREYQEQIVRVFHLASADAKAAAGFLRSMLKIREPFVDERSNMLALRDSQENIQLAERLVAMFDIGEPEVLLEVEVLEVSESRLLELGVKFPDSFSLTPIAPAGGLTLGNVGNIGRDQIGLGLGGLLVNLKREVGDFTTLANPRIRARNKEKAKILIGDRIPVVTTTTGTGGFVSDSVNYLEVGLKLDVEPTVYADDDVAIRVNLEVSSLGSAVRTSSGTLAYQIGTRNASTLLRLRDGETQLLAGLISREDRTSASRVPGAGDLPVLGRLFSSQLDRSGRSELILAITPRVLRNIRHTAANETELWVGTEALPRLRRPNATAAAPDSPTKPKATSAAEANTSPASTRNPAAAASAEAPPAARTAFQWSGPAAAEVGQTIEFKLQVDSTVEVRGVPVTVSFDPARLQLLQIDEGDFFKSDGASTSFSHTVDAKAGALRFGIIRKQASGIAGKGILAVVRFKALAAGEARISVDSAQPAQMQGAAPLVQTDAGRTVQIK